MKRSISTVSSQDTDGRETSDSGCDQVLFNKEDVTNVDNIWDDTALIKMYESSKRQELNKVDKKRTGSNSSKISVINPSNLAVTSQKKKWNIGEKCMAPYADGRWYPAEVVTVSEKKGDCLVNFVGYEEKASVKINTLLMEDEVEWKLDDGSEDNAESITTNEDVNLNGFTTIEVDANNKTEIQPASGRTVCELPIPTNKFPVPDFCPPPPSMFDKIDKPGGDKDALTNMLMSWYMSGYHTGYYQGLTRGKSQQN